MLVDYISQFERVSDLCDDFERSVTQIFFDDGRAQKSPLRGFCLTAPYQQCLRPIKACVDVLQMLKMPLGLSEFQESVFRRAVFSLENTASTETLDDLRGHLNMIRATFLRAKDRISVLCSAFDEEERERVNEAIHNYFEGCNYSCVAMSVSAAESRLLKLMCLASPDSRRQLEKSTLGQLIAEYTNKKEKYRHVMSERHEPLLDLCNTYRIFSVHAKSQKISGQIASAVLNLTVEFLTDPNTKPGVVQAQLTAKDTDSGS